MEISPGSLAKIAGTSGVRMKDFVSEI